MDIGIFFAYDPLDVGRAKIFTGPGAQERARKYAARLVECERRAFASGCGDPLGGTGICWGKLHIAEMVPERGGDLAEVVGGER